MSMPFFTCDRVYSIVYEYQIMIYVEKYLCYIAVNLRSLGSWLALFLI